MRQFGRDQTLELGHQLVQPLRRHIEPQDFDRDQPSSIGVVGAKDRTERSGTDLMKDPERSERVRRGAGSFRMQRDISSGRRPIVTRLSVLVNKYSSNPFKCSMLGARCWVRVRRAACVVLRAACCVRRAACGVLRASCCVTACCEHPASSTKHQALCVSLALRTRFLRQ
jgi:hypothetical protein